MSSNRELAERLVKVAPMGVYADLVDDPDDGKLSSLELIVKDDYFRDGSYDMTLDWTFAMPDTYMGNGDFIAWCKAEIRKQRPIINFSTHQIGDHWQASWTFGPSSRMDATECLYTSEAQVCVQCLWQFLISPLDGLIPPVDIQNGDLQ